MTITRGITTPTPLLRGADTIGADIGLFPPGLDVYSSYVDNFGGFSRLQAERERLNPHAIIFSYTIFGKPANCADVENGAMVPADLPAWLQDKAIPLPEAGCPLVYTSAGNLAVVKQFVGNQRVIYQAAHYGAGAHICSPTSCGFPRADGTQWDNKGPNGENYDRQLWHSDAFPNLHKPHPPKPEEYEMFQVIELQGVPHVFVEDKRDGSLWFAVQPKGKHEWSGGVSGRQIAGLRPFCPAPTGK